MKKLLALLSLSVLMFAFVGCETPDTDETVTDETTTEETVTDEVVAPTTDDVTVPTTEPTTDEVVQ
ncbi:MAG: hypothetical protein WC882_00305 [Candidatus Gracilibacteria bacterium]